MPRPHSSFLRNTGKPAHQYRSNYAIRYDGTVAILKPGENRYTLGKRVNQENRQSH